MKNRNKSQEYERNTNWQGVDKAPGKEKEKKDNVTMTDLKGKKVDADPEKESDQPVKQKQDKE
jgi:hypothetical protein